MSDERETMMEALARIRLNSGITEKDWDDIERELRDRRVGPCPDCIKLRKRLKAAEAVCESIKPYEGWDGRPTLNMDATTFAYYNAWRAAKEGDGDDLVA